MAIATLRPGRRRPTELTSAKLPRWDAEQEGAVAARQCLEHQLLALAGDLEQVEALLEKIEPIEQRDREGVELPVAVARRWALAPAPGAGRHGRRGARTARTQRSRPRRRKGPAARAAGRYAARSRYRTRPSRRCRARESRPTGVLAGRSARGAAPGLLATRLLLGRCRQQGALGHRLRRHWRCRSAPSRWRASRARRAVSPPGARA